MGTFSHLMPGTAHDLAAVAVAQGVPAGSLVADRGETGLVQGIGHHRAPFVWGDGRTVPGHEWGRTHEKAPVANRQ